MSDKAEHRFTFGPEALAAAQDRVHRRVSEARSLVELAYSNQCVGDVPHASSPATIDDVPLSHPGNTALRLLLFEEDGRWLRFLLLKGHLPDDRRGEDDRAQACVTWGEATGAYQDEHIRCFDTRRVQADEIWSFFYAKAMNVPEDKRDTFGYADVWMWTALDSESTLMVTWLVGERSTAAARDFMGDVAARLVLRPQITTDANFGYKEAIDAAFGSDVDYAQLSKDYGPMAFEDASERRSGDGRRHQRSRLDVRGDRRPVRLVLRETLQFSVVKGFLGVPLGLLGDAYIMVGLEFVALRPLQSRMSGDSGFRCCRLRSRGRRTCLVHRVQRRLRRSLDFFGCPFGLGGGYQRQLGDSRPRAGRHNVPARSSPIGQKLSGGLLLLALPRHPLATSLFPSPAGG